MKLGKFACLAIFIMLFGAFSMFGNAAKDVTLGVDLSDSTITVGESFNVFITIEYNDDDDIETDDDITIRIYKDGVLVHEEEDFNLPYKLNESNQTYTKNISSDSFSVDGDDIWTKNLMDYECDDNQEIKVEISGDVNEESSTEDIDITPDNDDNDLTFTISPANPSVTQKITVSVKDEEDDDLEDATVKFTRLDDESWDYDDDYRTKKTDGDGEAEIEDGLSEESEFDDDPYSKYQVDVYKVGEYCKVTKFFDTRRKLDITEIPSALFIGKAVKVKIVDDLDNAVASASLMVSKTGYSQKFTSAASGYASFTLSEEGTYNLIASKTGYSDSDIKSIGINVRGALGVSITPKEAVIGSTIKIVVTASDGSLLPGAKIQITRPDGTKEGLLTTPDTGQISYIPAAPGTYTIKVEEASHLPKDDSFIALNEFTLNLPEVVLYQNLEMIVRDQNGVTVGGAAVTIGSSISGSTDNDGKFAFKLDSPGSYTITVKKLNFRDKVQTIETLGVLKVELSSKEIYINDVLTIKVTDALGKEITDATIDITKPDSAKEISGKEYKPSVSGDYTATASKANYKSATDTFVVKRLPLELKVDTYGTKVVATVTSNNQPLESIMVKIDTIFGGEEVSTDESGKVEFELNITEKINVTISVNDPKYEPQTVDKEVEPSSMLMNAIIVIIVIIVVLVLVVFYFQKRKPGKGKEETRSSFRGTSGSLSERGQGSSLGGG